MEVSIEPSWKSRLETEFSKKYFHDLVAFVKREYAQHSIYPSGKQIFRAFDFCPFDSLRIVIIGQDPYHGPNQANGLCFSVNEGVKPPPSLVNIFKELNSDIGTPIPTSGNLEHWAKQGVLLLNATLTVRASNPGSHQHQGWEQFTDAVIQVINSEKENVVFVLWGAYAQKKASFVDSSKHLIIKSAHPSPFSAHSGFFGSKPFSKINNYLTSINQPEIQW